MVDRKAIEDLVRRHDKDILDRVAHGRRPQLGAIGQLRRDLKPLEPSWWRRARAAHAVSRTLGARRKQNGLAAAIDASWNHLEGAAAAARLIADILSALLA